MCQGASKTKERVREGGKKEQNEAEEESEEGGLWDGVRLSWESRRAILLEDACCIWVWYGIYRYVYCGVRYHAITVVSGMYVCIETYHYCNLEKTASRFICDTLKEYLGGRYRHHCQLVVSFF